MTDTLPIPSAPDDSLISENQIDVEKLFTDESEMKKLIQAIQDKAQDHNSDMTTEAGRAAIKSVAFKVVRSKTYISEVAKAYIAPMDERIKSVRKIVKAMEVELDAVRDQIKGPVVEFEQKEEKRVDALKQRMHDMEFLTQTNEQTTAQDLENRIKRLAELHQHDWQEFKDLAEKAKFRIEQSLNEKLKMRVQYEKDQKELAELRAAKKEQEERAAQEKKPITETVVKGEKKAQEPVVQMSLDEAPSVDVKEHIVVEEGDIFKRVELAANFIDVMEAAHPENPLVFSTLREGLAALVNHAKTSEAA